MNVYIARALTAVVVAAGFTTSAWMGVAIAHAATETVNLSDVLDMGIMYACGMEDGSDIIPALSDHCLWINNDRMWLTYEDHSLLIVNDTVVA